VQLQILFDELLLLINVALVNPSVFGDLVWVVIDGIQVSAERKGEIRLCGGAEWR